MRIIRTALNFPKLVWIAVAIGFVLRFAGIWYGLPLQLNIDEPALVSTVFGLNNNLNPKHFDWPHLHFYINAIFYALFSVTRKILDILMELPAIWYSPAPFFLVSRLITIIFAILTIPAVYVLTQDLWNKKNVSILAAFIIAILPIHVVESHWAKTDVPQTFFTTLSLIAIWRVSKDSSIRNFVISGILIGLTASIKYGGALMFFPLLLAYMLGGDRREWFSVNSARKFLIAGAASMAAFFIGTPFALLDFDRFFSNERAVGALWQIKNIGSVEWTQYPLELWETFVPMYQKNLGLGLWLLFLLLLLLFLFFNKRTKEYVFLLLPVLVFSFYISRFERSPDHYFLFLAPFYVPALAKFILELLAKIKRPMPILIAFLFPSILFVINYDLQVSREDTRLSAYKWVQSNLEENEDFLYVVGEQLESVPFKKNETARIKKLDRSSVKEPVPFYVVIGEEGVTGESLTTGNQDPDNLEGNSEPILTSADLVFEAQDSHRFGPPIYIFLVHEVELE